MRVSAAISDDGIFQVENSPAVGGTSIVNGRYVVEVPVGTISIDSTSYMLPVDGGDVSSLAYAELQARYPQFPNIVFNPLLQASDVGLLDFTATINNLANQVLPGPYTGVYGVRAQTGRIPPNGGMAPLSTAILPPNDTATPPKPGVLITDAIDITAATLGAGATDFLVYWKVYQMSVSEDISSSYGLFAGVNTPARKTMTEIDPELSGFVVALSTDGGTVYQPLEHLVVETFGIASNDLRLAFLNTTANKIYLATYAILF